MTPSLRSGAPAPSRRRGGVLLLMTLVVVSGAIAIGASVWKGDLAVHKVMTEGNNIVATESLVRLAAVPRNLPLGELDLAAIRKRVLQNPYIKEASVHRDFPDRVLIRVEERVPVASLVSQKLLYVDEEGVILPGVQSEFVFDLPVITGAQRVQECRAGKRITHPTLLEALHVVLAADRMGGTLRRRISEVHLQGNGELLLYTAEYGIPVHFGRGSIVDKLILLESFWTTVVSGQGGRALRAVDVRFADQVVARWEPTTETTTN
ncbi:MAG: FtsQ-type POTRA domain-containing protein [Bacteroidetes bacterium]|nr:FtsQ-type POTRA domain-containing protein [Bacteroidota bacterium]